MVNRDQFSPHLLRKRDVIRRDRSSEIMLKSSRPPHAHHPLQQPPQDDDDYSQLSLSDNQNLSRRRHTERRGNGTQYNARSQSCSLRRTCDQRERGNEYLLQEPERKYQYHPNSNPTSDYFVDYQTSHNRKMFSHMSTFTKDATAKSERKFARYPVEMYPESNDVAPCHYRRGTHECYDFKSHVQERRGNNCDERSGSKIGSGPLMQSYRQYEDTTYTNSPQIPPYHVPHYRIVRESSDASIQSSSLLHSLPHQRVNLSADHVFDRNVHDQCKESEDQSVNNNRMHHLCSKNKSSHSSKPYNSSRRRRHNEYIDMERTSCYDGEGNDEDFVDDGIRSISSSSSMRHHSRQSSDVSSFDDLFNGVSQSEEESDTRNIDKPVLHRISDRHSQKPRNRRKPNDQLYYNDDDEVVSILSVSSSKGTSNSSRPRTTSRSSSFHSQLSQLSQRSSQQSVLSRGSHNRNKVSVLENDEGWDSDDDMIFLIGKFDDFRPGDVPSVVDSGTALLSDTDSFKNDEEGSLSIRKQRVTFDDLRVRDQSPTSEQSVSDFGDRLLRLDIAGLEIDVPEKERTESDDELLGPDCRKILAIEVKNETESIAWWMRELKETKLLERDTSTIYCHEIPPQRQSLHGNMSDVIEENELIDQERVGTPEDLCDSSTVDLSNDVGDWEERLWSLARHHYVKYTGIEIKHDDTTASVCFNDESIEISEQTLNEQEKLYYVEDEVEQQGVHVFRSLLMKCIEAYVEVFHYRLDERNESKINSENVTIMSPDVVWTAEVNHYIPLSTASDLFLEVIKMVDFGTESFSSVRTSSSDNSKVGSAEHKANLVTSILVESKLNIFRKYQVVTSFASSNTVTSTNNRKLILKKGTKAVDDPQLDVESSLYGEMCLSEEKDDEEHVDQDAKVIPDTVEYEIRMRSAVATAFIERKVEIKDSLCWSDVFASTFLLGLKDNDQGVGDDGIYEQPVSNLDEKRSISSKRSVTSQLFKPLAQLYTARNVPNLFLRSLSSQKYSSDKNQLLLSDHYQIKCNDFRRLLFNKHYILQRLELQGPYDATITHLSDWHKGLTLLNNMEQQKDQDIDEYISLHSLLVSMLNCYLENISVKSGYNFKRTKKPQTIGEQKKCTENAEDESTIVRNYEHFVSTCLETGRALHHLGLCLGRRQRDSMTRIENQNKAEETIDRDGDKRHVSNIFNSSISLEMSAYNDAIEAYKKAYHILSEAQNSIHLYEDNILDSRDTKVSLERNLSSELSHGPSEMKENAIDEIHQIRQSKITVELHLADTLTCLGYCHDSKKCEFDDALMAYREALSLYIRHIGRFHKIVSNTLHNMGTIHAELKQWSESATCYRQSLAIMKQKEELEKTALVKNTDVSMSQSMLANNQSHFFASSKNEEIAITLEGLGSALAKMQEYDASLGCLQEAVDRLSFSHGSSMFFESNVVIPTYSVGSILSQMASIFMEQTSKVSHLLNWQCHMILFSTEGEMAEDPWILTTRLKKLEQNANDCIKKAIQSRRNLCYSNEKQSVLDGHSYLQHNTFDLSKSNASMQLYTISSIATPCHLSALRKDLILAGKLEFRVRSYNAAISYFYEALLINAVMSKDSCLHENKEKLYELLVFDKQLMMTGYASLKVTEKVVNIINLFDTSLFRDSTDLELPQLLFLLGMSYARINEFNKAKTIMHFTLVGIKSSTATVIEGKTCGLATIISQIDVSVCYLRLSFIEENMGGSEAQKFIQQAIQILHSTLRNLSEKPVADDLVKLSCKQFEIAANASLATAFYLLGRTYINQMELDQAMKCFEDVVSTFDLINKTRIECSEVKMIQAPLPFESRFFWDGCSALATVTILSNTNEISGKINVDKASSKFSSQCFKRAIELRDFFASKLKSFSLVDSEDALECFEESKWDKSNLECYSLLLKTVETEGKRYNHEKSSKDTDEIETPKERKMSDVDDLSVSHLSIDDLESKSTNDLLTKEDILFRMGNLQAKVGLYNDAIKSYKEAEYLTVKRLGMRNHSIIMNIFHNMGNAYRSIALSSSFREKESAKEKAINCYSESIRISKALFGSHHLTSADSMQYQALMYTGIEKEWMSVLSEENDDDYDIALDLLKESLRIRKKEEGNNSEEKTSFLLHFIGNLYLRKIERKSFEMGPEPLKLVDEAIQVHLDSLKIRKHILSNEHLDIAEAWQSVGQAYLYRSILVKINFRRVDDDITKAFDALKLSLELRKTHKSSSMTLDDALFEDSVMAETLCMYYLGLAEIQRNRFVQAKDYFIASIRRLQSEGKRVLCELVRLKDNPVSEKLLLTLESIYLIGANVLYHIASIHKSYKLYKSCINCYDDCLKIRNDCNSVNKRGLKNALICFQVANVLLDAEDADGAIKYFSHSLRAYLNQLGKNNPRVAETLIGVGKALAMKSSFQKSALCYDKALRIFALKDSVAQRQQVGMLHREIGRNIMRLRGDINEALEHYRSSVSFLELFDDDEEMRKQLISNYSEMLVIMREAFKSTKDMISKSELSGEICDVLHRMGNLFSSFARHNEAMNCFLEVLHNQRKTNNEQLRIADLLFNIGSIHIELKQPNKAVECLEESFDITKAALGEENHELHSTMYLLGVALIELSDLDGAQDWLTHALSVLKTRSDEDDSVASRGLTLYHLGRIYEKKGNNSLALSCFRESVDLLKVNKKFNIELSNAFNSIGNLLQHLNDFDQALLCYDQSLKICFEKGDAIMIANTKTAIGFALSKKGESDRALAFHASVLHLKTEQLGHNSIETGRALVNIGNVYLSQYQYQIALRYFEEGLRIYEIEIGHDHPDTASCLYNIGVVKDACSDESSLTHYLEAIRIFKTNSSMEVAELKKCSEDIGCEQYHVLLTYCLHNTGKLHALKKDFVPALQYMNEAFQRKTFLFGAAHSETATSQYWLGMIHLAMEDYESALFDFKESLKARVALLGMEHPDVTDTLHGLSEVHYKREEYQQAIECLNENIHILGKFKCNDDKICQSKLMIGSCYQELCQFSKAKEYLLEALKMLILLHGVNNLDVAVAYFRLGVCFCETCEYDQSLESFQKCLKIRTSLLGNLDMDCANTYESIGIVQQKKKYHEDAIHSLERALAIKKASQEENNEDLCVLLHLIGSSLYAVGRYADALNYFTDSTERKKTLFGDNDQEYALAVIDKAAAYSKVGDEYRSIECYNEAINSGGLSQDSWELGIAHKCVAQFFYSQGNIDAAIESYKEAVSIFEWILESVQSPKNVRYDDIIDCYTHLLEMEDDPMTEYRGTICYKLANCYVQVDNHQDAIAMYREAIMIQSQIFGSDHLSVVNSLHNLGNCYRDIGDLEKSVECLQKSLSMLTLSFGDDHQDVADTSHCLAVTMVARSELENALPLFEKALAIRKKKVGSQHLKTALTLYNLAALFQTKGSWTNAIKYCNEALKTQKFALGDNDPMTVNTIECLGRIHYGKREYENAIQYFKRCVEQGKKKLQHEIGIIHKLRGESDKANVMFSRAASYAEEYLGLRINEVELTSRFQSQKQQTRVKDTLLFADNIMFYGSVLMSLERFSEALECLRFSIIIFQSKYRPDHLKIAENLYQTGFILEKLSGFPSQSTTFLDEALDLLTEALRIRKLHLVENHHDIAETLLVLGKVHHKLGNTKDALNFITIAVKAKARKCFHIGDLESLIQLGHIQQQNGEYQEALRTFEDCLQMKQHVVGMSLSSIGELLFFIGNLLRVAGDLDLAEVRFKESLSYFGSGQGAVDVHDVYFSLGVLHIEQEKYPSALEAFVKALQIRKINCLTTKVEIAEILNNIGITYCRMKEYDKAQVYHAEALESLIEELGDDHLDVAFCWHSLGTVHVELHDHMEALLCFKNAVKIERSELYLMSLGICLVQMNDNENAFVCLSEALQMKQLDYHADDDMAEIQRNLGIIWMKKSKFKEALKCFEEALKIKTLQSTNPTVQFHQHLLECFDGALKSVSNLFGLQHIHYAKLLHQKGNYLGTKNEHTLATEAYIEALRIYKQEYGDSHLSVANTLYNLGISLNAKGSPQNAIRCFLKALRITKTRLGDDHLDIADTYEQIAASYKIMHNYSEAMIHFEKALIVRKSMTGGNDLKSSTIMHEIGKIYCEESKWVNAERAFKESLRIRTDLLGQNDALVAESMFHLGCMYKSQENPLKALYYFEGCLLINKSILDQGSLHLADIYYSLGSIHHLVKNMDKSIFCYDKAIGIYSEAYGHQHEKVVSSIVNKGDIFYLEEKYVEALSCFSQCLELTKAVRKEPNSSLFEHRAHSLSQIAEIYSHTGDGNNASSYFSLALSAYKQLFGPKHLSVANVLQMMALNFIKLKEFEWGYSCVREALTIRENSLGKDNAATADSHYCMGRILFECNKYEEAIKSLEQARKIHLENFGKMSLAVANANHYLGCICELKGDLDSALHYLQDSLLGKKEHRNEVNCDLAETFTRLGYVYCKQSDWSNAVKSFSDALTIRDANKGLDLSAKIHVADSIFDLGLALSNSLDNGRALQLFTDALKEYHLLLDSKDLKIANCLSQLGQVYEKQNDLSQAIKYLEKAIEIYEHHFGSADIFEKEMKTTKLDNDYTNHADTLYNLASAYEHIGEEATSLKLYRSAMKMYKASYGRDSLHVAKVLNHLANMKGRAGSVDKAMVLFDESLRIRILHLGNYHPDIAETLFGMGIVFEKRRDYVSAMKAYSDCLRIHTSRHGSDSMEVAQVVVNIGVVRGNKGDFLGAIKSWNKALTIYRRHGLDDENPLVAKVLSHQNLALDLMKKRKNNNSY